MNEERSGRREPTGASRLSDEAKLFVRMAAFGLIVGGAYWFLTREPAGLVLLVAFGLASAVAAIAIVVGSRRRPPSDRPGDDALGLPAGSDHAVVPGPGWAPLEIGVGLGGLALGAAFGPWLAIAGVLVALVGAKGWLDAVRGEAAASDAAAKTARGSASGDGSADRDGSAGPRADERA